MGSREEAAERRARRGEARAKVERLRAQLAAALAAKRQRMRELTRLIRGERVALHQRLRAHRAQVAQELRAWERSERAKARAEWEQRRAEAKRQADSDVARAHAELEAERAHDAEVARIEREVTTRAAAHGAAQSDEQVRILIPTEIVPLFERVRQSLRGGRKRSRAEVFLKLAEDRPDEVFALVEPRIEAMIRGTILELARARRAAKLGVRISSLPPKPANSNALTGGGPLPAEVERIRALESRPRTSVKGEGLDTTAIAKRIREDIKGAVKARELPKASYSVRTDKYSMGSSITVVASRLPFPVLNPAAFRVERGAKWLTFDSANFRSRFTTEAQEVDRKLTAIVDAYHWDRSDPVTDYYNERFAKDVRLTEDKSEWQKLEAAKVTAANVAEGRD
jgi:hypothetical protein